ncbi:MAG: ABC transporter permease, partial [Bacteroidota bacterium]|nr:ABC transporter permease [Bacteroidota bacterium]
MNSSNTNSFSDLSSPSGGQGAFFRGTGGFKIALRNMNRNKSYAFINVLGLSVGIASCLLIFLVLQFETSFDTFHKKKDYIYRIGSENHSQDGLSYSGGAAFPVGPALRIDFPQIKVASIFRSGDDQVTIINEGKGPQKKFTEDFYFTEPQFFDLFDFHWLAGDAKTTLKEPNSAVLTQAVAEKYFGDWHAALGKTIKRNNDDKQVFKINGILKNPPANTDFPLSVVVSYASLNNTGIKRNMEDWNSTFGQAYTFVELPPNYAPEKFNADLRAFAKKYKSGEDAKDAYVAQPLRTLHYDDRFGNFSERTFSTSLVNALRLIGIFLLLIACVNFINLATAQAVNRSKEVGVRKVLGSNQWQLAIQFLTETAVITTAALLIAVGIAYGLLPFLNQLLKVHIALSFSSNPVLILFLLIVAIAVTLLSGLYPAFVLSRFNPIVALKSKVSAKMIGGISLRRALVVLQFAIAHVLIIGTLIVVNQMNFFRNASLGFDKAAIITVPVPGDSVSRTKIDFLRNQLQQNPDIKSLSFSFSSPSAEGNWNSVFKFDTNPKNVDFSANLKWADADYFKTYNLPFVAGRPYYPSDTVREFVVNETLLKKVGITDPKQAIGKKLDFWDGKITGPIVGVVRDFNSYSLREPMAPVVLGTLKDVYSTLNIKIRPGKEKPVLTFVEK